MTALSANASALVGADRRLALELTAQFGQVLALLGPNGAGKSAAVDLLLGLRRIESGDVVVRDVRVDGPSFVPPEQRRLGWVPQMTGLLPRLTVMQQVARFARPDLAPLLRGAPGVDALLAALRIDHLAERRPGGLSGGEAQRVAVARAMASSDIVLLDEPTSAQDAAGSAAVRKVIGQHRDAGGAVLVVSHRPEDAWLLADEVCVLEDLQTTQQGRPEDLAAQPATSWVALLAGTTVLRGIVDEAHVLRTEDGNLVVADTVPPGPVTALVRPGAVTLHGHEPTDQSARNVVTSTVRSLDEGPGGLRVVLDGRPGLTASLTRQAADDLGLRPGTTVWATVKATDVEVTLG